MPTICTGGVRCSSRLYTYRLMVGEAVDCGHPCHDEGDNGGERGEREGQKTLCEGLAWDAIAYVKQRLRHGLTSDNGGDDESG